MPENLPKILLTPRGVRGDSNQGESLRIVKIKTKIKYLFKNNITIIYLQNFTAMGTLESD